MKPSFTNILPGADGKEHEVSYTMMAVLLERLKLRQSERDGKFDEFCRMYFKVKQ
jgi:hypothetical protein